LFVEDLDDYWSRKVKKALKKKMGKKLCSGAMSAEGLTFIKTYTANGVENHLPGKGDYTLCGLDAVGDDLIHLRDPEANNDYRVTCPDCLEIIRIVSIYQKMRRSKV
jgi:hypothetical protein